MHIFPGACYPFPDPLVPAESPCQPSLPYLLKHSSTWLQGGSYPFWCWQWVKPIYEARGGKGWMLSGVMLLICHRNHKGWRSVWKAPTVQAEMGSQWLKGSVIAVSKHLENNHRKWKQDLLQERPEDRTQAAGERVGVQRGGCQLSGKAYPGSPEHSNPACACSLGPTKARGSPLGKDRCPIKS